MEIALIIIGFIFGSMITFLWTKQKFTTKEGVSNEKRELKQEIDKLVISLKSEEGKYSRSERDLTKVKENLSQKESELRRYDAGLATFKTKLEASNQLTLEKTNELIVQTQSNTTLQKKNFEISIMASELKVSKESIEKENRLMDDKLSSIIMQLEKKNQVLTTVNQQLATEKATNEALVEKLETQDKEIEALGKKFNLEFQNIANKILEEKAAKFTDVNKVNLESILQPLRENLSQFKQQVENTYNKEARERFSLGEQVKEMSKLNKIISDEARNLTTALKGEAKTQGNWGEMILESILEKSGLRKDEEYFMEYQLEGKDGNALRSDSENKKMRPDAVIKYPDNRSVIIDSKVSLNAFTRYLSATEKKDQDIELQGHITAIKTHIISLSTKGYDDYDQALDFVMMFIPSEPAYIAAMQGDSNLWNFAYDKRILLMNPTNLITSLKLMVDLWKREYQNQNAIEIAERGSKLYDKFVGFVKNLDEVGSYINKANGKYEDAYRQLSTGNDNLVLQATKLKNLGLKNKKSLSKELENKSNN